MKTDKELEVELITRSVKRMILGQTLSCLIEQKKTLLSGNEVAIAKLRGNFTMALIGELSYVYIQIEVREGRPFTFEGSEHETRQKVIERVFKILREIDFPVINFDCS